MTIDVEAFVGFEAAGFSARAAAYHRHFGALTGQFADPLLDATGVSEGSRVLDVASGPGQVVARGGGRRPRSTCRRRGVEKRAHRGMGLGDRL